MAVANIPDSSSNAVAELTLLLILASLRKLSYFDKLTREGNGWSPDLEVLVSIGELYSRSNGFIGYGAIAKRVATICDVLGANIFCTARSPKTNVIGEYC